MHHYLGFLDATKNDEQNVFLPSTFVYTRAIIDSLSSDVAFICGRKGSGKSAIVTRLSDLVDKNGEKLFDKSYGFSDSDYGMLHESILNDLVSLINYDQNSTKSLESCYFQLWSYMIEMALIKTALEIEKNFLNKNSLYQLNNYYKEQNTENYDISMLAKRHCIDAIKLAKESASPLTEFSFYFEKIRASGQHKKSLYSLKEITTNHSICVYIDTLELYDISDYRIYSMRGMCRAVKDYMNTMPTSGAQVKCCLPAELTDDLFQENLAKYNEYSVYLVWSYSELLEFLARRFCKFLTDKGNEDALSEKINNLPTHGDKNGDKRKIILDAFWNKYFPAIVNNNYGFPEVSCAYLIRHTQKRPREVMSCMNHIIEKSIEKEEFPNISEKSLVEGIHCENNLWQLLTDNLAIYNIPRKATNTLDVATCILSDENFVFSGKDFSRFSKRALSVISDIDTIDKPGYAKELLIKSGLIGRVIRYSDEQACHIFKLPGVEKETRYYITEFEYLIPGKVPISEESLCAVHPILADRLKLGRDKSKKGVVYPIPENNDISHGLDEIYKDRLK